eukprot:243055-Rhodomonas_salina.1
MLWGELVDRVEDDDDRKVLLGGDQREMHPRFAKGLGGVGGLELKGAAELERGAEASEEALEGVGLRGACGDVVEEDVVGVVGGAEALHQRRHHRGFAWGEGAGADGRSR